MDRPWLAGRRLKSSLLVTVLLATVLSIGRLPRLDAAPAAGTEKAIFSMYCYWTGEAALGRVPGVVASRIGSLGGREVVEVEYDPRRADPGRLAAALSRHGGFYSLIVPDREAAKGAEAFVGEKVEVRSGRPSFIEPKHSLRTRRPELYYLDLTESQAIALNSWSYFGGRRPDVLTPEQEAMLAKVRARLAEDRSPSLEPARDGAERERYRRDLLAWLGE